MLVYMVMHNFVLFHVLNLFLDCLLFLMLAHHKKCGHQTEGHSEHDVKEFLSAPDAAVEKVKIQRVIFLSDSTVILISDWNFFVKNIFEILF